MSQLTLFDEPETIPDPLDLSCLEQVDRDTYAQVLQDGTFRLYQRIEVPHVKFRRSNYPPVQGAIQGRYVWRVSLRTAQDGKFVHWHKGHYASLPDAFGAFQKEMIP